MPNAYMVISKQLAPHPNTESIAEKHRSAIYRRPFSDSQLEVFAEANASVVKCGSDIILDSGCGTGDSSFWLADQFPDSMIVGADQSLARLAKANAKLRESPNERIIFVRARLEDFWRLVLNAKWPVQRHYLFYPNPWPKPEHHLRRWHGHPVFPGLLELSPFLEVRSNWLLYLEEFAIAAHVLTGVETTPQLVKEPEGVSAFEKKYVTAHSPCFSLQLLGPRSK